MKTLHIIIFVVFYLCAQISSAQVFKYIKPNNSNGIVTKLLANGNQHKRWKQVIFSESKSSGNNSLITDALMVDFGVIESNTKEIKLLCTGGFTDSNIEIFFVGDTDFFSIDVDTSNNVWQRYQETNFEKKALQDLYITIRPKVVENGLHKAFLAFKVDEQLYRVAIKAKTSTKIFNKKEDVSLNLGLVEADSTGFTDYKFTNLGELPLDINYDGDSLGFFFMIGNDTLCQSKMQNYVPISDTLTLSIAPIAIELGDKYGGLVLKNNYVEQHIYFTSRVEKIRGEVFWEDTTGILTKNISVNNTTIYNPLDTIWLEAKFYNNSDYDTLYNIDSLIEFSLPTWLKVALPKKELKARSSASIPIPLTLMKSLELSDKLRGIVKVKALQDSSIKTFDVFYKPKEKLISELFENTPSILQFSSHTDTFEIKLPYLNTGKNAIYPKVESILKELHIPDDIKVFYGSPRIKEWRKGYISVFLTPYSSVNFHKTKVDTLSFEIYGKTILTKVELIQEPWTDIIKDYTNEILLGLCILILVVLGLYSPKIYKISQQKIEMHKARIAMSHKEQLFKQIEKMMKTSALEKIPFEEGIRLLKEEMKAINKKSK